MTEAPKLLWQELLVAGRELPSHVIAAIEALRNGPGVAEMRKQLQFETFSLLVMPYPGNQLCSAEGEPTSVTFCALVSVSVSCTWPPGLT
jgi:hypothetical protein